MGFVMRLWMPKWRKKNPKAKKRLDDIKSRRIGCEKVLSYGLNDRSGNTNTITITTTNLSLNKPLSITLLAKYTSNHSISLKVLTFGCQKKMKSHIQCILEPLPEMIQYEKFDPTNKQYHWLANCRACDSRHYCIKLYFFFVMDVLSFRFCSSFSFASLH